MKSRKLVIYASLATLLLSGSKLTVEASTGSARTYISEEDYINNFDNCEELIVENITFEEVNEYIKQGYTLIARSEVGAVFIRNNDYINSYNVIDDYVNYPGNYEKLVVENITIEEANKYAQQGYTLIGRSEMYAEFIRNKAYGKANEIIEDYINSPENYEKLIVENITVEGINQYSNLGYTVVGVSETSAELIRNRAFIKPYSVLNGYISNPENYEELIAEDITFEEANEYVKQGYTLISRSDTNAVFIRKQENILKK